MNILKGAFHRVKIIRHLEISIFGKPQVLYLVQLYRCLIAEYEYNKSPCRKCNHQYLDEYGDCYNSNKYYCCELKRQKS